MPDLELPCSCNVNHVRDKGITHRGQDGVTIGILRTRWTDDGDKDVAAVATMYIAEVPKESSMS